MLQQGAQHLHAAAAPRQAQEGQARFRSYRPVHPQGVVHQHALGPAGDGQHAGRRIAAQQRRLHVQVALDLLRGGDGAAAREGPGGRRGAHEELGEVRRGGVERPVRPDGDVLLQPDAAGGEAGQQRAVFGAKGRGGVPDLQVRRGALQQGRLDEARGRERVDGEVRRGGHPRAVLQGGDPAVDGRDRAAEGVEGRHQRVAAVALALAPAVRLDLDDAAVAQDRPPGEGRPEEQAAYELGRELVLDEVEEAVALGHRRVPSKVPGVERREVAVAQVPPVRLRLGKGVAGELERGVREDGVGRQGRPGQEGLDLGRRHVGAHQGLEAAVGADRKVPGVGQRLGEEARAGDGVVDLGLGPRAGPVLGERGRELGIQLGPGVER